MQTHDYAFAIHLDTDVDEADERVRDALSEEGFGILTEIDVQATLKEKLGEDLPAYRILGACNPPLAHKAILADGDIGALLPCNVVVREHPDGGTDVLAADPETMLELSASPALVDVASDAKERLVRALSSLE